MISLDFSWFIDLQEALVFVFTPVLVGFVGVIFLGSILAAILNVFLEVAGHLFRS